MSNEKCKSVWTLNCILNNLPFAGEIHAEAKEIKQEIDKLLNEGYAVRVGCTATGHTLSEMVETAGANYIKSNYDVEVVNDYWDYYKLKESNYNNIETIIEDPEDIVGVQDFAINGIADCFDEFNL